MARPKPWENFGRKKTPFSVGMTRSILSLRALNGLSAFYRDSTLGNLVNGFPKRGQKRYGK